MNKTIITKYPFICFVLKSHPFLDDNNAMVCKGMSLNSENIYYQAKEASNKDTSNVLNGLSKKDLVLIRYCLENNVTILKNKELASLFGVTSRAISKWMVEWVNKGILIPNGGITRITSYKLSDKYASLKVSDIGFTD